MRAKRAALMTIAVIIIGWSNAAIAVTCNSSPGRDGRHWIYSTIDGRRCWYAGPAVVARTQLRWPRDPEKAPVVKRQDAVSSSEQDEIDVLLESYWPPLPKHTDGSNARF
jgi:hypothetical protein